MDAAESSAPVHPSTEVHDDIVEAHYSCLERLGLHACIGGWVFVGYLAVDSESDDEVEIAEAVRCGRCV